MSYHVHVLHPSSVIHIRTASLTWRKQASKGWEGSLLSFIRVWINHPFLANHVYEYHRMFHALSFILPSSRSGLPRSFEEASLPLNYPLLAHPHLIIHLCPPRSLSCFISLHSSGHRPYQDHPSSSSQTLWSVTNNSHSSTFCHPTSTTTFTHGTSCSHTFIHLVVIHVSSTWVFPHLKQ
jgi:hypothetical protein